MKNNPMLYPSSWIWYLAGLLVVGVTADLALGSGSRYLWGAIGGVIFVIVGGLIRNSRQDKDPKDGG